MMKLGILAGMIALGLSGCVSGIDMSPIKKDMVGLQKIMQEDPKTVCKILIEKRGYQRNNEACSKNMSM